jgi:hypothetical protein
MNSWVKHLVICGDYIAPVLHMFYWVLAKVPRGQTHSADQLVPGWRIVEAISLMGFQTILRTGLPNYF